MDNSMKITFSSSLSNITSCNDSFDTGKMMIAYHGKNHNRTFIGKETFERNAKTMYNVPVVANYIREDDTIGGHDMEIVRKDGNLKLVNSTHPVGVVPESANYWWETVTEDDGAEHEYLCADVLLWKRQEAYQTIKENGITAESMEIDIKSGHKDGGIYYIDDFQFLAFCLLGNCSPCFESASVSVFSADGFADELRSMLAEVPSAIKKYTEEVSNKSMNEKLSLMEEFGLKISDLDFELSEFSLDELKLKFEEMKSASEVYAEDGDGQGEDSPAETDGKTGEGQETGAVDGDGETGDGQEAGAGDGDGGGDENDPGADESEQDDDDDGAPARRTGGGENYSETQKFALFGGELIAELHRLLSVEKIRYDWGEYSRYWLIDVDAENHVIYCEDGAKQYIYVRMNYTVSGDAITIDFDSAKRVKHTFVDFDDGANVAVSEINTTEIFAKAVADGVAAQCNAEKAELNSELETLRKFKSDVESEQRKADEQKVFARFVDLESYDEFAALKSDCAKFSLDELEEKCYAIRGRHQRMDFSATRQRANIVLPVSEHNDNYVPYGGLVEKYK